MKKNTLKAKEAAEFMEMNVQTLKAGLIYGTLSRVGTATITGYKKDPRTGKERPRYMYHIPRILAERYMGMSYEKWLKRKEGKNG